MGAHRRVEPRLARRGEVIEQVSISPTTRSACLSSGASPTKGPMLGIASIVNLII
jgi:hypothetical protein